MGRVCDATETGGGCVVWLVTVVVVESAVLPTLTEETLAGGCGETLGPF